MFTLQTTSPVRAEPEPVDFEHTRARAGLLVEPGMAVDARGGTPSTPASDPIVLACASGAGNRVAALLLRIPPPLIYVACFLAGMGIQHLIPLAQPRMLESITPILGAGLLAVGIVLGPLNALVFLFRGTTLNPARAPLRIFTGGIYRISRNPMYLGLFLIYTAVTLLLWEVWSMLLVIVPFIVVDRVYIPCEEARMELQFGDAYRAYCASVRRWLGRR